VNVVLRKRGTTPSSGRLDRHAGSPRAIAGIPGMDSRTNPNHQPDKTMNNTETLKRYYAAMEKHDWATKRSLMCDDLQFRGPLMQANSADELLAAIKEFDCAVRFENVEMIDKGDVVMSFFTFSISKPFEGAFRMAERVQFRDGKVQSSELIYDARSFPEMKPA
jgi:ketosteroid isomerase-like protein